LLNINNKKVPALKRNVGNPCHLHCFHWYYFFIFPLNRIYANFIRWWERTIHLQKKSSDQWDNAANNEHSITSSHQISCLTSKSNSRLEPTTPRNQSARRPLLCQSNNKIQVTWKGRGSLLCYGPTFPLLCASHGRALGPCAYSANSKVGGNYYAQRKKMRSWGNWTQDLDSDLDDSSSASPTIKPRWYGRDEGVSYAMVQH
jgi:hypothetical protein